MKWWENGRTLPGVGMYTIHIAGQDFPWPSRNLLFVGDVHCSTQHILPLGMFVLMYEHCMYIVQSFHLTVFYLKSIAMIQCKLGKQNFWNKVEYPWVLSTPLETLGFFQTNEKAFPCRCFPFGSLLKKVYLYWLKILRQSLLKFVDSSPLFDIRLPRLDLILNSPLSQHQFGFRFYFIQFRHGLQHRQRAMKNFNQTYKGLFETSHRSILAWPLTSFLYFAKVFRCNSIS